MKQHRKDFEQWWDNPNENQLLILAFADSKTKAEMTYAVGYEAGMRYAIDLLTNKK